jgi:hypothetical protein
MEIREIAKEMIRQIDAVRTPESPDRSPFHYSIRAWGLDKLANISSTIYLNPADKPDGPYKDGVIT